MSYAVVPIGVVHNSRVGPRDDDWGKDVSRIELGAGFSADALDGLDAFSHVEVLFLLHRVDPGTIVTGRRHPRENPEWPKVGIFAQRGRNRPNRIGSTICRIVAVEGSALVVAGLDAIDGTPVLDIKPVMAEFLPREPVRQPAWSHELMRNYWVIATDNNPSPHS